MHLNPAEVVDGRYKILSSIGEGGMGTVYKALELELNRTVALKFIHSSLLADRDTRHRFFREGKVLSRLAHPHILTFYRLGLWNGQYPFVALEFAEGLTLRQVLDKELRLDWTRAVTVVAQVADAMNYAHASGIVHRDLKPNNIMLVDLEQESSSGVCVKVLDFGLASAKSDAMDTTITRTGSLIGSVYYMSPEQCGGEKVDGRSDIYSLGCILFELLAGEPPFVADSPIGLIQLHRTKAVRRLSEIDGISGYPPALDSIVAKAMEKDRDKRYQSMDTLRKDLLEMQGIEYIPSVRPSKSKPKRAVLIGAVLAVLIGIGTVWIAWEQGLGGTVRSTLVKSDGTMTGVQRGVAAARSYAASGKYGAALQLYTACIDQLKSIDAKGFLLIRLLAERGELLFKTGQKAESKRDILASLAKLMDLPEARFKDPEADAAGTVFDAIQNTGIQQQNLSRRILSVGLFLSRSGRQELHRKAEKTALLTATGGERTMIQGTMAFAIRATFPGTAQPLMSEALRSWKLLSPEQRPALFLDSIITFDSDKKKKAEVAALTPSALKATPVSSLLPVEELLDDEAFHKMEEAVLLPILARYSASDMPVEVRIRNAARVGSVNRKKGRALYRQILGSETTSGPEYCDAACGLAALSCTELEVNEAIKALQKIMDSKGSPVQREHALASASDLLRRNGNTARAISLIEDQAGDLRVCSDDLLSAYLRALLACNRYGAATIVLKRLALDEPIPPSLKGVGKSTDPPAFQSDWSIDWVIKYNERRRKKESLDGLVYVLETALKQDKWPQKRIQAAWFLASNYREQRKPELSLRLLQNETTKFPVKLEPYYYCQSCLQIARQLCDKQSFSESQRYLDQADNTFRKWIDGNKIYNPDEVPLLKARLRRAQIEVLVGQNQLDLAKAKLDDFRAENRSAIDAGTEITKHAEECEMEIFRASKSQTE